MSGISRTFLSILVFIPVFITVSTIRWFQNSKRTKVEAARTLSSLPYPSGQSKSQGQSRFRGRENRLPFLIGSARKSCRRRFSMIHWGALLSQPTVVCPSPNDSRLPQADVLTFLPKPPNAHLITASGTKSLIS